MKKLTICVFILTVSLVSFIVVPQIYAAQWSTYMKVTGTSTGIYGTYVYTDKEFPSGGTVGRITPNTDGHNRMMASIMTAIALNAYIRFWVTDDNNIMHAYMYTP